MSDFTTASSQFDLPLPLVNDIHVDAPSTPSSVNCAASTTVFTRAQRIKLAGRIKQSQSFKNIKTIKNIKNIKYGKKIKKIKTTKDAQKARFCRSTFLPPIKLASSSTRSIRSSRVAVSHLGKRIRHHSNNPSIELDHEPTRSVKKPKHWTDDSSDSENPSSISIRRPQPVNIPGWIEARKNKHQEQVAPCPWRGSVLRSRSSLYRSTLGTETSISSSINPRQLLMKTTNFWPSILPPIVQLSSAASSEINRTDLEESRREQQFFYVSVLLFMIILFSLFLLLL